MDGPRAYTCRWCHVAGTVPPDAINCPACGAAIDVRLMVDDAGWYRLPPIPDMARLQFGHSRCQIEGAYVPVADFDLAAGDRVYFAHHTLLWKEPRTQTERLPIRGWWRRLLAGLPLVMVQAKGPGRIAFSRDRPGEIIAVPLEAGTSIDVREGAFLAASGEIHYDWFRSEVWYRTSGMRHYPVGRFMDRFTAAGRHGLLLLHGEGNVFVRELAAGQSILVKPPALVYKSPAVEMSLQIEHPLGFQGSYSWWRAPSDWRLRYVWLRLRGPGRVAIQSAGKHWEDPPNPVAELSPGSKVFSWQKG
jgi:uncharacterized protein (AIM24 family)